MPDRAVLHLTVIVEGVEVIRSYLAGKDRDAFLANPILRDAVVMRLQTIGEAARSILPSERLEAPEIAWNDIVAFRHRVAHDYRSVDFEIVWSIIANELDALDVAARRMLAARGEA